MQAPICTSSSSSIRAIGMPVCRMAMTRLDRAGQRRELADGGAHRLGDAVQAQRISVMTPSVPSEPIIRWVRS